MALLPAIHPTVIARREPNLLLPGKKPVGPVEIDWSHPLARGLKHFYLPTWFSKQPITDLCNNKISYSYDTAVDRVDVIYRNGRYFAVPEGSFTLEASYVVNIPTNISSSDDITTLSSALFDYIATKDVGHISFNNSAWSWLDISAGVYRVSAYTAYDTTNPITSSDSIVGYGLIWKANGAWQTIRDGSFSASGTRTREAVNSGQVTFARAPNAGSSVATTWHSRIIGVCNALEYQAIWARALSEQETADFYRNPYQILKPANSTPYLISVPTSGATVTLSSPTATATGSTTATVGCTVTYT